ncbi:LAMI_0H12508g1_1 [Lachancea mirantina]|uniref:DNA damage-inducible protein 1 n=1 Tax=Lachancea mirantina TaxID=1230905 RepID=A0A1G4KHW3_9SACH|nr:LAMI_0H12508g1_1 [Lachancea mirantina]
MKVTVSNSTTDHIYGPVEVSSDMSFEDFVALIQFDCDFDDSRDVIEHQSKQISVSETRTLEELGIGNDDLVIIRAKSVTSGSVGESRGSMSGDIVETLRQQLIHDHELKARIGGQVANLDAILNDPELFRQRVGPYLQQQQHDMGSPLGVSQDEYNRLMQNPDDPASQARIAELINLREIDEQMRSALEFTPEVFAPVHMLYVNLEVNGHPVKAFVDSGAQATIISTKLAQETDLLKYVDKRFQGLAKGVGSSQIHGKIHVAQIKIESQFIPCSFTVLDTDVDMLLGLDMLKRHQACIDLEKNVLKIAGIETRFLPEAEIPKGLEASVTESLTGPTTATRPQGPMPISDAPKSSQSSNAPNTSYSEEPKIRQLMDLGFSRSEAIQALKLANGNVDIAAAMLF